MALAVAHLPAVALDDEAKLGKLLPAELVPAKAPQHLIPGVGGVADGEVLADSCIQPAFREVLRGALVARFYYIYAVDYDRGGEWSGQAFMCTRDKEFTIKGTDDCLARGFDRAGFFEVGTAEQPSWTVQLTESAEQAPQQPLQSRVPLVQPPAVSGRPSPPSPQQDRCR